jgi:hypothetical protein
MAIDGRHGTPLLTSWVAARQSTSQSPGHGGPMVRGIGARACWLSRARDPDGAVAERLASTIADDPGTAPLRDLVRRPESVSAVAFGGS